MKPTVSTLSHVSRPFSPRRLSSLLQVNAWPTVDFDRRLLSCPAAFCDTRYQKFIHREIIHIILATNASTYVGSKAKCLSC